MAAHVVGRARELRGIERFLDALDEGPALLVFEGEPGIGKTTLVRAGVEAAKEAGAHVLSCAPGASETPLSYSALADLVAAVEDDTLARLPRPQRSALEAAVLRSDPGERGTDRRAVATGVLSLLEDLARARPVVVAIDDLQWLDQPSARALEFCVRRLTGRIGLIASRRLGEEGGWATGPVGLRTPDRIEVQRLSPFDVAELGRILDERARTRLPHPALARVHEASGGNPFYALELVRALGPDDPQPGALPLPASLDEMVAARLEGLGTEVEEALIAVAALAEPTVDLVERAAGEGASGLLDAAEARGLVEVDGQRVRFTHPLLAHGVYARATSAKRRALHRRLSGVVSDPEERARHLAHAGAPEAVGALDDAARQVRARGAPDGAAELLELALGLGAGPELAVRAAEHHFDAGDPRRAQALLEEVLEKLPSGHARAEALLLLGEIRYHDDSYAEAHELLERARAEDGADERVRVMIDLRLGFMLHNFGRFEESAAAVRSALAGAERLGDPGLLGEALASAVITEFAQGRGFDEPRLIRALELHDPEMRTPGELRPANIGSFLYRWTGRLDESRALLEKLAREHAERGEEHDLAWLGFWRVSLECSAGDLPRAVALEDDAVERLLRLGTPHGRALALAIQTTIAAHLGRADAARDAAEKAFALYDRAPWELGSRWVRGVLVFLELSVGDQEAAAASLGPLAGIAASGAVAEPNAGDMFFHGDAAEALVAVGRMEEVEAITSWLEDRGAALDRTWATAIGARCRGLLLAAQGEVAAAEQALERALAAHDRLPMPIERARTLLALGRVRRRLRKRRLGKEALEEALETFEALGSPRWAEQARAEIGHLGLHPRTGDDLTPSEERVASLAATGLTNREMAASLGISPKTVEAQLGRAYRKLGISSRAELGARMAAMSFPRLAGPYSEPAEQRASPSDD